ncbi:MAG: hypothetical protein SO114_03950 [Candidatus Cryptobacteroides sp.]|nr:hypothetical protein [Candidatus Cryptobacteroides sp.]
MKKLSVLAMAMIVMASCAKENVQPNNEPTGEKALLEIGLASTKTQLGTEDKVNKLFPILWSEGDEIAVIENMGVEGKQNVSVYSLRKGAGTANGVFELVEGSPKVTNNVDVVYPASAVKGKGLIGDIKSLVPKVQTQSYTAGNFDPNAAVMHFHGDIAADKILLQPLSSIVCIPIKGSDTVGDDIVTAVKWQNMDGRTVDVTLNCPGEGVTLSKETATNFYLSIPPMQTKNDKGEQIKTVNAIVYVYLQNGAIQVKTPRERDPLKYEAGSLHRFPEWTLSKKAKWTILGYGSQRDATTWDGVPLGPAQYMIDGNDLSWWESRREPTADNNGRQMAGPHTVVIDLGSVQNITGIRIKSKESKGSHEYGIKLNDGSDVLGTQSYNPPHTFHIVFMEKKPGDSVIKAFTANKTWPTGTTKTTFQSINNNGINYYYGADKKTWWDNKITPSISARYVFIHFEYAWNNDGNGTAAPFEKVAELDIY